MCSFGRKIFKIKPDLNICKIFKPIYICLTLFGILPYSVKFIKNKQLFKIIKKSIYFNSLCAISTNLVIYGSSALHIRVILSNGEGNFYIGSLLSRLNYVIELVSLLLVCSVVYVCTYINRHKYIKILNGISSVWLDFPADVRCNILKYVYIHMCYIVITLLVCMLVQVIVNFCRGDSTWKIILVLFTFLYPQTIQMTALTFHHILNVMLASTLTGIQELIVKFEIRKKIVALEFINVNEKEKSLSLKQIESVYSKISQITKDVNHIFRAIILMTILQCFRSLTGESYFIFAGVVKNAHTLFTIVNCSAWIIFQLLKVISLSYTGNLLKDKVCNWYQIIFLYFYMVLMLRDYRTFTTCSTIGH